MSAQTELESSCRQWRKLAQAEGDAIRRQDWGSLAACQSALQQLQPHVDRSLQAWRRAGEVLGTEAQATESSLKAIFGELINLERRNAELLRCVQDQALARLREVGQASRNLRLLRATYAISLPAGWSSFS